MKRGRPAVGMSLCSDCNTMKKNFAKGKCKMCYDRVRRNLPEVIEQKRLYRETHAEELRGKNKEYQEKNRDKVNAWHRKYYQTHKELVTECNKRYRETHPQKFDKEVLRENAKRWRAANPEKVRENAKRNEPAKIAREQAKRYIWHRKLIFDKFQNKGKKLNRFYQMEAWEQRLGEMDAIFIDELSKEEGYNLVTIVSYLQGKIEEQNKEFKELENSLIDRKAVKRGVE